jgi:glycosyltransferase involved in cell wall biosynthesis
MRIGVNALYLIPGGVGGTEIYLRHLLAALSEIDQANRYFIFTNRETGAGLVPTAPHFVHVPQRVRATSRPARILWEQIVLPVEAARLHLDLLFNPGFTAPVYSPCDQITVFHDLQHKRHPEYFRWFDLPFWRLLLFCSAQLSRVVLADSASTAADLRHYYRLSPNQIRVVPLGVDAEFFEIGARRQPETFLLCVSTLHPHKNLDRLLRAFAGVHRQRPEYRLVIPGIRGFHTEALERLRAELGLKDVVEFTGWIPRKDLLDLYAHAAAFVYPSTFEGFGLPVLEAMAAGVPVACSRIAPLQEVSADAVLYFYPASVEEIEASLLRLTGDHALRGDLAVRGPRRAAHFPWTETARRTLRALNEGLKD